MVEKGGADPTLVYELKNTSIQAGTTYNTEVPFLSNGFAGTYLLDINVTVNVPTDSSPGSQYRPAKIFSTRFDLGFGKPGATYGVLGTRWEGGSWENFANTSANGTGRKRLAIIHEANSKSATFMYKDATTQVLSKTMTASAFTPVNTSLTLGGNGAEALPTSIINSCRIYSRVLSQSEIDEFFA